jgi:hypothetical protein
MQNFRSEQAPLVLVARVAAVVDKARLCQKATQLYEAVDPSSRGFVPSDIERKQLSK